MSEVDYQVEDDGANDCRWYSSYFGNAITYLEMGWASGNATSVAVRFQDVTIPDGATIDAAYLQFYYVSNSYKASPAVTIYGEDDEDPSVIESLTDGAARVKTTASVSWVISYPGTWLESSDISDIITELMESYSYAAGAAMQFIIIGTSGTGNVYVRSYDYTGNVLGAKLHIEYTSGGVAYSVMRTIVL
ncbi:TPA_asm: hypothetical protein vir530_00001 [dsDNA virus vir530]|nr:TPA_asm: hypothetical protein vir530_00001 [dsDNA virus vir530]